MPVIAPKGLDMSALVFSLVLRNITSRLLKVKKESKENSIFNRIFTCISFHTKWPTQQSSISPKVIQKVSKSIG